MLIFLKYLAKFAVYLSLEVLVLLILVYQSSSQALREIWTTMRIQDDDISYGAGIKWSGLGFGVNSSLNKLTKLT